MFEFACDLSPTIHNFSFVRLTSGLGDVSLSWFPGQCPPGLFSRKSPPVGLSLEDTLTRIDWTGQELNRLAAFLAFGK